MQGFRTAASVLLGFALALGISIATYGDIPAGEASTHIGSQQTVCGKVASAHYARTSNGRPTFINLGRPYPNQVFTAVIWGSERRELPEPPEEAYAGKHICLSGRVSSYRGVPQIKVRDPSQIAVQ